MISEASAGPPNYSLSLSTKVLEVQYTYSASPNADLWYKRTAVHHFWIMKISNDLNN